jgi:hypothetical protein
MRQEAAQPVLLDERGEPYYLTGEVSVRFTTPLNEEELRRFAGRHGLRLVRRNQFVPQQAVFQPLKDSSLPELAHELERETGVRAAWANALRRYQRVAGF